MSGFPRILESPGFFAGFSRPGKSWKISLVLESLEMKAKSWKVLENEYRGTFMNLLGVQNNM